MRTRDQEHEAPCGLIGVCAQCTPWGFGVASLSLAPRTAQEVAADLDHYWTATYLTRVFDQLVRLGVLELLRSAGAPVYGVNPLLAGAVARGDCFDWIDSRFVQWGREPRTSGWDPSARR